MKVEEPYFNADSEEEVRHPIFKRLAEWYQYSTKNFSQGH